MKKLLFVLLLSGCSVFQKPVPIKPDFPAVPNALMEPCPQLRTIPEGTTKISEVASTVAKNYGDYSDCKDEVSFWIEWYTKQKQIYDNIK